MGRPKLLTENRTVTFHCEGDMCRKLQNIAHVTGKKRSEIIRLTLNGYLDLVADRLIRDA